MENCLVKACQLQVEWAANQIEQFDLREPTLQVIHTRFPKRIGGIPNKTRDS